jgi:hypothetical protein
MDKIACQIAAQVHVRNKSRWQVCILMDNTNEQLMSSFQSICVGIFLVDLEV